MSVLSTTFHRWGSPPTFYRFAGRALPWFGWPAVLLIVWGLFGALWQAPADYQQGEGFRIIYAHVPAAWMSLFIYTSMAVAGTIVLIWRMKVAEVYIAEAALIGAGFTAVSLATGMLWGKPMWGTWWVWDARLTSQLILLFLYLGVLALHQSLPDARTAARACAILAVVGVINVPVVHYSVEWWNTLHQGASITRLDKPAMPAAMLWPLLQVALGCMLFFGWVVLLRMRSGILWRERRQRWVQEVLSQ